MENRHLALKDIDTIFPVQAQKEAEKFPLREVEEAEKGHWVAFADDGPSSYDVQLTLEKSVVVQHSCDCGKLDAHGFCLHQLAMLMQLSAKKSKTVKQVTKRKAKEDPLTTLVDQIEHDELKSWVKEILRQQKDLAIAFTNRFAVRPVDYTNEDIQKITDDAVKSVVKNKKKIDQSELKKILLLWKDVHEPVMANYLSHIASVDKIELLSSLILSVHTWHQTFNINSTKIITYKKDLLAKTVQSLYDIENENSWKTIIAAYFKEGFKPDNKAAMDWLNFLSNLVTLETRPARVDYVLDGFKQKYIDTKSKKGIIVAPWFTELVYNMYKSIDRQIDCIHWIKPIHYQNVFNLELIDELLLHGFDSEAEHICLEIIGFNGQEAFNHPFLRRLAGVYKKQPLQRAKLYPILLQILPYMGEFEDYLILTKEYFKNREEEARKWRTKLLNKLEYELRSGNDTSLLYFDILHYEGKISKMMEKLTSSFTIEVGLKYFDSLFAHNKLLFLDKLFRMSSSYDSFEGDDQFFATLAEKVQQQYSGFDIMHVLSKVEPYWKGRFAKFYEESRTKR